MSKDLVSQIERDALDDEVPIARALRKCVALGGESGSEALRDWATRELQGYPDLLDIPDYRIIQAPLRLDGIAGNFKVTGEELPPMALPEFARDDLSNELRLTDGIGMLEDLAKQPEIKLMPPGASNLALLMNAERTTRFSHINAIYWAVAPSAIRGVLDQVRTALVQLVAEMRSEMARGQGTPSKEEADQAVNVVVTGKRARVRVTANQASAGSAVTSQKDEDSNWSRIRLVGSFLVGLATLAAAVFAAIQVF